MEFMKRFEPVWLALVLLGALNWALVALFDFNVVEEIVGTGTAADVVYDRGPRRRGAPAADARGHAPRRSRSPARRLAQPSEEGRGCTPGPTGVCGGVRSADHAREAPAPAVPRTPVVASACLVAAYYVPPWVTYVLVIASFGLLFEAGTAWFARAGGTGGLKDFRQ